MAIKKLKNRSRLEIDLTGPDGNAFALLGRAKSLCAQLGIPFKPLSEKMTSGDYENLVKILPRSKIQKLHEIQCN